MRKHRNGVAEGFISQPDNIRLHQVIWRLKTNSQDTLIKFKHHYKDPHNYDWHLIIAVVCGGLLREETLGKLKSCVACKSSSI